MKLTPIFPPHIKPVHEGVYRVWIGNEEKSWWAYWDGCVWGGAFSHHSVADAVRRMGSKQNKRWQGVEKS